jgi:Xaa-Pro aminopeptidase
LSVNDLLVHSWTSDYQRMQPVDLRLVGDSRLALPALLELLPSHDRAARDRQPRAAALAAEGADGAWSVAVAGRGEYDRVDGVPRHRPIERGELVYVDCGANVGGYWADFSRAGVVGGASDEQRRHQEGIREATLAGVEAMRPGATLADVARATARVMERHEYEFSSRAGRYGHGLGLLVTEPPDVAERVETVIQPGMVLTIEPGVIRESGIFHCEENVLVTENGPEVLSLAPWELAALG